VDLLPLDELGNIYPATPDGFRWVRVPTPVEPEENQIIFLKSLGKKTSVHQFLE
jgi:hypothetical protein